ncbi:MAG: bifunctional adenosylcobinamide kinase/adenosylcobinamide-phosphate guanylyltransferase [Acidobacteriota bacterium]|jgi:adenosylcobinamide kinase/adenosylcobinamide-phosphate guanylyltransferase|nr:bifunctional adenosylcobinamide kinase/adenosylcobinamide-phosphate guanylyltransferase [Acidobacteriota bacterium]
MGKVILVTGGSRSGKSSWAQKTAESISPRRVFIATCPVIDDEMRERIRKHRQSRDEKNWHTIEEPLDIAGAIDSSHEFPAALVDCLTLWINNLMYRAEKENTAITETDVAAECRRVIDAAKRHPGAVLFVTNEVGMGIIPENAQARLYRDLAGRCNQVIAEACDRVVLMISGLPLEMSRLTAVSG